MAFYRIRTDFKFVKKFKLPNTHLSKVTRQIVNGNRFGKVNFDILCFGVMQSRVALGYLGERGGGLLNLKDARKIYKASGLEPNNQLFLAFLFKW